MQQCVYQIAFRNI